nr:uncharacterized protein LOC128692415 [Cherax quadricarinatus]
MSRQRQEGGINLPDIIQTKAFKIVNSEGRHALFYIFSIACPKKVGENLKDYFINVGKMEEGDFIKWFTNDQLGKICDNPSGSDFDITLLCRCLGLPLPGLSKCGSKVWSSKDETKLEWLITKIKNDRNNISHIQEIKDEPELIEFANNVNILLDKTYRLAGKNYKCDKTEVENKIFEMKKKIDEIVNAPLTLDECQWQIMKDLIVQQENHIQRASAGLKEKYKIISKIHPASFITHVESLKVQSIYSKVEVVEEQHESKETKTIDHDGLLELKTNDDQVASVIIVEGEAGMGKTTLIKLILAEWANLPDIPNTVRGLDEYELILHSECRNQSISTFLDLVLVLFDQSSVVLSNDELLRAVLNKKSLVLLDGVDEWNENSKKLAFELIGKRIPESGGKLQLLCTTRPEKVEELLSCLQSSPWIHTRIQGIHPDKQNEFVVKFMQVMHKNYAEKSFNLDTEIHKLKEFLKKSHAKMGEQFKLPLNLALLTYLWVNDSDSISMVTTATELYSVFHDFGQRRLLDRLFRRQDARNKNEWKKQCDGFLCILYRECLIALSRVAMQMPKECTKKFECFCSEKNLPLSDILECYMEVYREWGTHGYLTILAPPHKTKLEFFSAHGVINEICLNQNVEEVLNSMESVLAEHGVPHDVQVSILEFAQKKIMCQNKKTILGVLEDLHSSTSDLDFKRYQNMLIMMAGILSKDHEMHLHNYGSELLQLLKNSGLSSYQFLNIVAETKNNNFIAQKVSEKLTEKVRNTYK